jgi:hypothetical protein
MARTMTILLTALATSALAIGVPAGAAAAVRSATAADARGDAPAPYLDILRLNATYDTAGKVSFDITMAEPGDLDRDTWYQAYASSGPNCDDPTLELTAQGFVTYQQMLLNGTIELADPHLAFVDYTPPPENGFLYRLEGTDARIANQPFDCFELEMYAANAPDGSPPADDIQVKVAPETPGPRSCRILASRVRRGQALVVHCSGVAGALTARFRRRGTVRRTVRAAVGPASRARFATRRVRRGRYRVTIYHQRQPVASRAVRVR